mgnify:CR=1 FL=1
MKNSRNEGPSLPILLKAHDPIVFRNQAIQLFLVGLLQPIVFIHPVDAHRLLSAEELAFAQGENTSLFHNGKRLGIALLISNRRTVEEDADIVVVVQHEIPEAEGVPKDLGLCL